jgi:hypothetical protein
VPPRVAKTRILALMLAIPVCIPVVHYLGRFSWFASLLVVDAVLLLALAISASRKDPAPRLWAWSLSVVEATLQIFVAQIVIFVAFLTLAAAVDAEHRHLLALAAMSFIVVGLVAVIRRRWPALTESSAALDPSLGMAIGLFLAALFLADLFFQFKLLCLTVVSAAVVLLFLHGHYRGFAAVVSDVHVSIHERAAHFPLSE